MGNIFRAAMAFVIVALLFSTSASAFVFRNVTAEMQKDWDGYVSYKQGYIEMNGLKGYEQFINEPTLMGNYGFHPASYYYPDAYTYNMRYNPPLQGDVYSTDTRPYANSLNQPSAVKFYAENTNGRLSGYVMPDFNGVYFDHPQAQATYGYISSYPGAVGYGYGGGYTYDSNARFYARVASQVSDDYYVVGYQ